MLDDYDSPLCGKKHYGPILQNDGDSIVMRCSCCNQIFRKPLKPSTPLEKTERSSNICIQACDWIIDGDRVTCRSCSYIGPVP